MKVLYLITRAERGGAQVHVLDLIRGFRHSCGVELAIGEEGFLVDEARKLGVQCHILRSLVQPVNPLKDTRALWEITKLLMRTKPNLLHAHTSKAGVLGRIAAWFSSTPAVFTAHTWCFAEGTSLLWKMVGVPLERLAALPGGKIINVSESNRALALHYHIARCSQMLTIHNGVPESVWLKSESQSDPPNIVMIARFASQKNQAMLLEALSDVKEQFVIRFVGDGPTRPDMEQLAKRLGLADRVQFLGDRSDVASILSEASIFALPTNWEGFPLSILEAMRAGLPVVANDVGGVRESVEDGVNGILVPRGDRSGFARALEKLLAQPQLRIDMGTASRRIFERSFTSEHMLQKTFQVYQQEVSREGRGQSSIPSRLTQ